VSTKQLKWAVIGATGYAGKVGVREISASSNGKLAAIQALPEHPVATVANQYGVPWYNSVETMLDKTDCDAVYIASPQSAHFEHLSLCAERGKHVMCEKPLAIDSHEAEAMLMKCRQAGVKMGTGFNLRFHALHLKAKQLIADGVIGKVVSARCQYGQNYPPDPNAFRQQAQFSGGGSMVDMGNHAMDLVEFVTGKRFSAVMAVTGNVVHQYSVEDSCGALLEFKDGGFAFVDTYYCVPLNILRNDLEVNGSEGILYTIDSLRGMVSGGRLVVITAAGKTEYQFEGTDMYRAEFEAFAAAVLEDREPPCGGLDGLHSQYLLDAIYSSAKLGKKVHVKEITI